MKVRYWLATVWTFGILLACFLPAKTLPPSPTLSFDKFVHFGMFAVFAVGWCGCRPRFRHLVVVAIMGVLYAVGTEFLQGVLPGERTADVADALANLAGLAAGLGASRLCRTVRLTQ